MARLHGRIESFGWIEMRPDARQNAHAMTTMPARLNTFQRTMLHWNDLHPYNAVHVVRIPQALDPEPLTHAINGTLEATGLTNLVLNRSQGIYCYQGGPMRTEIKLVSTGGNAQAALAAEIEDQLNRGFTYDGTFNPFRFFIVPEAGGFFLGVVYFHAVADAESLVHLLKRIVDAYRETKPAAASGLEIHPQRRDNLLLRRPWLCMRKLAGLPAQIRNLRSSYRVAYRDASDGHIGFTFLSLPSDELRQLITVAKSRNVTVNDLLLALLMKCLCPLATGRKESSKRRKLSVGCIVNTRKDLALDSPRTFGLFLGSFVVTHEVPEDIGVVELAGEIQRQTAAIKQQQLYLGAGLELAIANRLLSFYSTERRKKLYQKHYPLWGGLTNMNLNTLWAQSEGKPATDYFRAVSTGPVTPLVLSVTTVGDRMNVGLTCRTTVFSAAAMATMKDNFLQLVRSLVVSA